MLSAYHLPALPHVPGTHWSYGRGESELRLRVAQITAAQLAEQIDALLEAREEQLAERPIAKIVEVIDAVAGRFLDPADEVRRTAEAALPLATGFSPQMVRRVLDGLAAEWRAPQLWGLLRAEFGDPEILDGFRPRGRAWGRARAVGPRLATQLLGSGNPTTAPNALVRSLLVKAATLSKTTAGDLLLPVLFARAVAETDPGLGRCIAVTYWPAGDEALDRIALDAADAVIVHGPTDAVVAARAKTPAAARFLGYEQRVSFGVVARESLGAAAAAPLAARAALDVAMFDQQACSSPHLFYVELGGEVSPREWAALLGGALAGLEEELPRGALSPGEAAAVRQQRSEAEATRGAGGGELHASADGAGWAVIYDPTPGFRTSCRNRVVRVKPVEEIVEVAMQAIDIAPGLQAVGVAGPDDRIGPLAVALARIGASRIAPIGSLASPPGSWHHDGRPPLRDLVRWCDWE